MEVNLNLMDFHQHHQNMEILKKMEQQIIMFMQIWDLNFSQNFNLNFLYRYNKANTDYDQWGGQFGDDPTYIYKLNESTFRTEANRFLWRIS